MLSCGISRVYVGASNDTAKCDLSFCPAPLAVLLLTPAYTYRWTFLSLPAAVHLVVETNTVPWPVVWRVLLADHSRVGPLVEGGSLLPCFRVVCRYLTVLTLNLIV